MNLDYTVTSNDPTTYNIIRCNLQSPATQYCKLTVTNLTTKCAIIVLDDHDYITINGTKFMFEDEYTDISAQSFIELLIDIMEEFNVKPSLDNAGRIVFTSQGSSEFTINDASYNAKQIAGLYDMTFPIKSVDKKVTAGSVGNTLSTPVLYLVSNIGAQCYRNMNEKYNSQRIVMRINNSFSANFPIINSNSEFTSFVCSNDLSNVELRLVDANLKDIKLLSPMFISISAAGVVTEETPLIYNPASA